MAIRAIIFDYFGVLASRYGVCDPEVMQFIEQNLLGKYKLAVLSNMNGGTAEDMLGECVRLFDQVMISGELGVAKPDGRAFLEAARRLEEFPSDCLMIDDSQVNCTGAEQVGLESIYFAGLSDLRRALAKYDILTS